MLDSGGVLFLVLLSIGTYVAGLVVEILNHKRK